MSNYQLPEGYKQTEVGVIPEDWDVEKIGGIANILIGKDLKVPNFSNLKDSKYRYPVYSNTTDNRGLYGYYDHAEFFGDSLTVVGRGVGLGTAFSRSGGFGAIGRLVVIFPVSKCDSKFLADYINHKINVFHESSGIPQLTGIGISKYKVALPPLPEQKAIAQALSDVDALIAALDKLIAKKRHIKTATMQQLLTGKKRLPGFGEGKGYKKTDIGVIPEDWEVNILDEIVDFTNGKAHEGDIKELGQYIVVNSKFISSEAKIKKYSDVCYCPAEKDSILMVMSDVPNGKAIAKCFLVSLDNTYTVNQRICCLKITHAHPFFVFCKLNRNPFYLQFDDGVKQTNLRREEVLSCPLSMPALPEQKAIAQVLSDMDTEITALEKRRAKTQALKQGMMQELLTGRTRLSFDKA